jgi:hypothetical protein
MIFWCSIIIEMFTKTNKLSGAEGSNNNIHQPTCCGGMCVDMSAEGCCSCRVPFHIYPLGHHEKGQEVGKITKVWGGFGKEILTVADSFELHFPDGVDQVTKARLLGATFMINQLFFENSGGVPETWTIS